MVEPTSVDLSFQPVTYWSELEEERYEEDDYEDEDDEMYLPKLEKGEVEIVCITLNSMHCEQTSIRAKKVGNNIRYRIVGEYEKDYKNGQYKLPFRKSEKPVSLKKLIQLIDGSVDQKAEVKGLVTGFWSDAYEQEMDVDEAAGFVEVSSPFYPQLETYYQKLSEEWANEHRSDDEEYE